MVNLTRKGVALFEPSPVQVVKATHATPGGNTDVVKLEDPEGEAEGGDGREGDWGDVKGEDRGRQG